jgi:hypothetical protein
MNNFDESIDSKFGIALFVNKKKYDSNHKLWWKKI